MKIARSFVRRVGGVSSPRSALRSSALGLSAVLLAAAAAPAPAQVLWNWSYGGTEAGTFTTDGSFAQTATSGSFNVSSMSVTSSVISGAVGASMNQGNQPGNGFLWNGTAATQFFRDANNPPPLTNGSSFYTTVSGTGYRYGFGIVSGTAVGSTAVSSFPVWNNVVSNSALTLTPSAPPSGVPEIDPAGVASVLAIVGGALGMAERRLQRRRAAA